MNGNNHCDCMPTAQKLLMSSYWMALNWFSRGTHVWALAAKVIPGGMWNGLHSWPISGHSHCKATSLFVALISSPLQFFTCNRDHIRTSTLTGWCCVMTGSMSSYLRRPRITLVTKSRSSFLVPLDQDPICPARALRRFLKRRPATAGDHPLFISARCTPILPRVFNSMLRQVLSQLGKTNVELYSAKSFSGWHCFRDL